MSDVFNSDGTERTLFEATGKLGYGRASNIGNSQVNRVQVDVSPYKHSTIQQSSRTGAHELGHSAGLRHFSANGDATNLMADGKLSTTGIGVTGNQRTSMSTSVPAVNTIPSLTPLPHTPMPGGVPLPSGGGVPGPIPPSPSPSGGTIIPPSPPIKM